jgi:hypothetical protein
MAQRHSLENQIRGILKPGVLSAKKMGQSLKPNMQLHTGAELGEWS